MHFVGRVTTFPQSGQVNVCTISGFPLEEGNNPQNIRDLAALITVREYLATRSAPKADAQSVQESADDKKRRDAVVLMTHSADLDTVPTIQQVETALHSISVNTPEERKRVQDAKKWAQIISQKNA